MYGVASIETTDDADVVRITGLVEKPSAEDAPSNYAVIGRYVLQPEIFDVLEKTEPGKGNEIQLTDALETLANDPSIANGVYGVVFRGRRYDTGDKLDYIKAIIQLASDREDLGGDLRPWLKEYVKDCSPPRHRSHSIEGMTVTADVCSYALRRSDRHQAHSRP